jgi:catechol-2,3-dioxygenase
LAENALTTRGATATTGDTARELTPPLLSGFCELTLETSAPTRLERFYCECFGCGVISRDADRIWLACGERARLGLWTTGAKEFGDRGGRHVHFALSASPDGFDQLVRRLDEKLVTFQGPVKHPGGDRSLYIEDPEGNVVEVWDFFERAPGVAEGVGALT